MKILVAAVASMIATTAGAQSVSLTRSNAPAVQGNPDRLICEREDRIGSRLSGKKVCLKASEWAARKQENRETLEKEQMRTQGPRSDQ